MIIVYDDAGRELLLRLLEIHPEWEGMVEAGEATVDPSKNVWAKLLIPSEHPTILTPLTVELVGYLRLLWHGGYFVDFVGKDPAADAFEFLQKFFSEEVCYGIYWRGDVAVLGGPVDGSGIPSWLGDYDRIEVRSWRGNRDATAVRWLFSV